MKEKIERFSKGEFEYELPLICLSEEEIKLTIEAGKMAEGSFTVSNSASRPMKGLVYSTDRLMVPQNTSFYNAANTIHYQFNAASLKAGQEIHGEFNIVSDCGEISIPFEVQVESCFCMSSLGKIKDLFQFTNLARMDWSEAKRVFRSQDFEHIFLENEDRYQLIYRNLLNSVSTSQALEEFLIAIHKKPAIRLEIDKTQAEYQVTDQSISDKLTLTKNHWGYAEIRVSTDATFIQLEQKFLWADRFIGNTHQVSYCIEPKLLRHGINYGNIWIRTAHQTIKVEITCRYSRADHKISQEHQKQKIEFGLTDAYLSFRLNQIDLQEYMDQTEALIEKLPGPEVSFAKELMKTHLAIISGRNELAEELISDFTKIDPVLKKKSPLEYSASLYLEALYRKDEETIQNAADTIRNYYTNGNSDWRILWLLLYTDKQYEYKKDSKLEDIREQFDSGCHSPILYYEAVCALNEEPYLLRDLTDFEIQVLNFGIKNWILSQETAKQYTYLAGKLKAFNQVVFNGLVKLYDEYGSTEILSAICCMLIKGMKKSEKYFEWYRLGVEAQLRITELYEYYVYSISDTMQEMIDQPVLLYFIYNSSLNDSRKAFLYAGIVKNKDINEPIYRSYYKKMEVFSLKMLESHYISRDLAVLYHEFVNNAADRAEILTNLPYVMYRNELECSNQNMVNAIVIHRELGSEVTIPLVEGRAQVDIYTDNFQIIFADSFGNRYAESIEYTLNPYMDPEEYENSCMEYSSHPMLLLHLFDRYQKLRILNEDSIELRKKVLFIEGLSKEYITSCHQTLIEYYYDKYNDELLDFYLNQINLDLVNPGVRGKIIELLLLRSIYEKAMEALDRYGYDDILVSRLVKLCSNWIQTPEAEQRQDFMVDLCYYVFSQGKYDDAVLRYLIRYYNGSTRQMYKIWQAARGFELESHDLEERLLTQMLFAESYIEDSFLVFSTYYKEVTNHLLVRAFLSFYAYKYLIRDQVIDTNIFPIIKREIFYEENDVCLLAWLKNNASSSSLPENDAIFAEYNIQRLAKRGIVLPFFLEYRKKVTLPDEIMDKLIIEYHADPGKRIYIHYRLTKSKNQEFITERMPDIFHGIHTKEFTLFYHEELQYYISEETEQENNVTESTNIRYECEVPEDDESNYNHINLMLMSMEMQEDSTLLEMMQAYAKKEYMISKCFKQIDETD